MKKIIIISIALLALTACESKQVEEVKASSNQSYPVEKLFTVDGITVYRFRDSDRYGNDKQNGRCSIQLSKAGWKSNRECQGSNYV